MKTIFLKIAAILVLIPALAQAAGGDGSSGSGTGSGNGDGDRAFALQNSAKNNARIPVDQMILKAFAESLHRVPQINYFELSTVATTVFIGRLSNRWSEGNVQMSGREYLFADDGSTVVNIPRLPIFSKIMSSDGPFGQPTLIGDERFQAHAQGYSSGDGKIEATLDSLVFTFDKQTQPGIEMREYSDKIYVYIVHSVTSPKGGYFCPSFAFTADQDLQNDIKVHREICAVGYFWK